LQAKHAPGPVPPLEEGAAGDAHAEATMAYEDDEDDHMDEADDKIEAQPSTVRMPEHAQTMAYSDEDDDEAEKGTGDTKNRLDKGAEKTQAYGDDDDDGEETQDDDAEEKGCGDNGEQSRAGEKETDVVPEANGKAPAEEKNVKAGASGSAQKSPVRKLPAWATTPAKASDASPAKRTTAASKGSDAIGSRAKANGGSAQCAVANRPADEDGEDSEEEVIRSQAKRGGVGGAASRRQAGQESQVDSQGTPSAAASGGPKLTPTGVDGRKVGESDSQQSAPGSVQSVVYGASPSASLEAGSNQATLLYDGDQRGGEEIDRANLVPAPTPSSKEFRGTNLASLTGVSPQSAEAEGTLVYDAAPLASCRRAAAQELTLTYDDSPAAGAPGSSAGAPGSSKTHESESESKASGSAMSASTLVYDVASGGTGASANTLGLDSSAGGDGVGGATLPYDAEDGVGGVGGATLPYDADGDGAGVAGATLPYDADEGKAKGGDDATMVVDASGGSNPSTAVAGKIEDAPVNSKTRAKQVMGPPAARPPPAASGNGKSAKRSAKKPGEQITTRKASTGAEKRECDSTLPYDADPSDGGAAGAGGEATLAYDAAADGRAPATLEYVGADGRTDGGDDDCSTLAYDADAACSGAAPAARAPGATAAARCRAGGERSRNAKKETAREAEPDAAGASSVDGARGGTETSSRARDGRRGKVAPAATAAAASSAAKPAAAAAAAAAAAPSPDPRASGSKRSRGSKSAPASQEEGLAESEANAADNKPAKRRKGAVAAGAALSAGKDKSKVGLLSAAAEGPCDAGVSSSPEPGPTKRGVQSRVAILISGIRDSKLESAIVKLKGTVEEEPEHATHLVTDKDVKGKEKQFKITAKVMAVVGMGRPVVDRKWVDESSKRGEWLPVEQFIISDEKYGRLDGQRRCGSGGRAAGAGGRARVSGGIFEALSFFRMEKFEMPFDQLEMVIKAAGGEVTQDKNAISEGTIVLAGEEDHKKFGKSKKPPWAPATEVQKKDFIKACIMNGELDRKQFRW